MANVVLGDERASYEVASTVQITGLQWLVLQGEQDYHYSNDAWPDAVEKWDVTWLIERANARRLGGFADWRLPTGSEFMAIAGTHAAPPQGAYWTASDVDGDDIPRNDQTAQAKFAAFSDDGAVWLDTEFREKTFLVRLVRTA